MDPTTTIFTPCSVEIFGFLFPDTAFMTMASNRDGARLITEPALRWHESAARELESGIDADRCQMPRALLHLGRPQ